MLCVGDGNSDDDDDVADGMNGEDVVDSDMSDDECQAASHQQDSEMTE